MIYYVEDDMNIRDLALYALHQSGLAARGFSCAEELYEALNSQIPDALLLDIMLPRTNGLEILKTIRADETTHALPVMMITAKGSEFDTVSGLDAGADDYLTKPFGMMELVSRVKALLRRASLPAQTSREIIRAGRLELSLAAHTVHADEALVELTLKEFDLLAELMQNAGRVLTRDTLLERVWAITYAGETRTVDVHIQTLRSKISALAPGAERAIKTVRGVGYMFQPDESDE